MAITALPTPPSRSDPVNFPERADAFMAALPGFAQEANLLQAQVNEAAQASDEYATAAGTRAQDAATSRNQAVQKAADAGTSASAAASANTAAQSAAALAAQWASKTGAPVSGGEFSAKHYALQAAIAAGLPVYSPGNSPTSNVGSILVSQQGPMEWVSAANRYEVLQPDHAQCVLTYVNTSTLRLLPRNGNGLVINGRQYRLSAAGVDFTSASTTAATAYYLYAKDNGSGGVVLEARVAAGNPHSRHTNGVEILTGNPAYTLVGWFSTTGTNTFLYTTVDRRVLSWFNRTQRHVRENNTPSATASTADVQLTSGVIIPCWAGEEINFAATGVVYSSTASVGMFLSVQVGGAISYGGYGYTTGAPGSQAASAVSDTFVAPADGTYSVAPFGRVNSASGTFRQNLVATSMI